MSNEKKSIKTQIAGKLNISVVSTIILTIFCFSIIGPFIHELAKSLSHPFDVDAGRVTMFPINFTLGNYEYYIRKQLEPLSRAFFNTVFLVFVGGILSVIFTMFFAFPLSRPKREFRAGSYIIYLIVFCIIFQRPIIPLRLTYQMFGLLDSLWAIVINMLINPFFVILAITYFKSLPESIFDAARIDGANELKTFMQIILPLCKTIVVTIFLMQAVAYWNSYMQAKILIIDPFKYPIQNFIQNIMSRGGDIADVDFLRDPFANSESVKSSLLIMATIPLTIVYISLQKHFTKGMTAGAVKG